MFYTISMKAETPAQFDEVSSASNPKYPYISDEYNSLKRSLGKEILVGVTAGSNRQLSFILDEIDGEATFLLTSKKGDTQDLFSEKRLLRLPYSDQSISGGYYSTVVKLCEAIKKAQGHPLRACARLIEFPNLTPLYHVPGPGDLYPSKNRDLECASRIEGGSIGDYSFDNNPFAFFSTSDFYARAGVPVSIENRFNGFTDDTFNTHEEVLLDPRSAAYVQRPPSKHVARFGSETRLVSLKKILVLRWAGFTYRPFENHQVLEEYHASRNFRWELSFLGSTDVLGSAEWNDFKGITNLTKQMQDIEALELQQILMSPEFFQ